MADVRVVKCSPDEPEVPYVLLVVDPAASHAERAVAMLGLSAYEGDGCFSLLPTDGWIERKLEGTQLTVDVFAYPSPFEGMNVDLACFGDRSAIDQDAIHLLKVTAEVDAADICLAREATLVVEGKKFDEVVTALLSGDEWPVIFGPPRVR